MHHKLQADEKLKRDSKYKEETKGMVIVLPNALITSLINTIMSHQKLRQFIWNLTTSSQNRKLFKVKYQYIYLDKLNYMYFFISNVFLKHLFIDKREG